MNPPKDLKEDWNALWSRFEIANRENPAQRYRQELMLCEIQRPSRLLEIGCGSGEFLSLARKRFPRAELAGADVVETALRQAKEKCPQAQLFQINLDDPQALGPAGWASHIVCSEVIEHLDHPETALRHCFRLLAPGGKIILTVPSGPRTAFDRHLGHRRHFRSSDIRSLLRAQGFEEVKVHRSGFPFFNIYRLLILARGKALVSDASRMPKWMTLGMGFFRGVFRANMRHSPFGWQLVVTAHRPV